MAVTVITPTRLLLNVASADLPDAGGTVATTPADGWDISMPAGDLGGAAPPESMIVKFGADASGDTVVIAAGDNPPAMQAGMGSLSIVLAALDYKYVVLEGARFLQSTGVIHASCTDAGTMCQAFGMPRESGRGGS